MPLANNFHHPGPSCPQYWPMQTILAVMPAIIKIGLGVIITAAASLAAWLALKLGKMKKRYLAFINQEMAALEKERESITSNIYDNWGPMLSAVKLRYGRLGSQSAQSPSEAVDINRHIDEVIISMRDTAASLVPTALALTGLASAIIQLVRKRSQQNLKMVFIPQPIPKLPYAVSLSIYRVVEDLISLDATIDAIQNTELTMYGEGGNIYIIARPLNASQQNSNNNKTINQNLLHRLQIRVAILQGTIQVTNSSTGNSFNIIIPIKSI